MSDLLVYVNENVSWSVIIDNLEVMLDTFCWEILEDQVSDVLPSHYKFTKLLSNQHIVFGLKQEVALKLSQCMQKTNDIFAVHFFHEEGINLKANEPGLNHVLSKSEDARDDDQDQVPPRKKVRVSRQPTLFDMCTPTTSSPGPQPTSPYSAARAQRVKIYSKQEVDECIGMKKSYRQFWNDKAEELCRSNALKTFKPGEIQGAINVAWSLKKTDILKDQSEKVNEEIASKCSTDILKKCDLSRENVQQRFSVERVNSNG